MSTVNQLIRGPGASPLRRARCPPRNSPQKRGVCTACTPHAEEAELRAAQGRQGPLTNGHEVISYIGGEGHNLQEHSVC